MTTREIENTLREIGKQAILDRSVCDSIHKKAMCSFEKELNIESGFLTRKNAFPLSSYVQFGLSEFIQPIRHLSFATACMVIALCSGWIATVNASITTIPGDVLYPLKLASERMQITLANNEQKARLHAEFAARRLQEVSTIQISNTVSHEQKAALVKTAVQGFQQQIADSKNELQEIQKEDPAQAANIAVALGLKANEYEASLQTSADAATATEGGQEVQDAVHSAIETVIDANHASVETLLSAHENSVVASEEKLQQEFQQETRDLTKHLAVSLSRTEAIKKRILEQKEFDKTAFERVKGVRETLGDQSPVLVDATNRAAEGAYRRSFELLGQMREAVRGAEGTLIELEIGLSFTESASDVEPESGQKPESSTF